MAKKKSGMNVFERYLTLWVWLCMIAGIFLGRIAPGVASALDGMSIFVDDAPVVSMPIATSVMLFGLSLGVTRRVYFSVQKLPHPTPNSVDLSDIHKTP
jgi:ACR3 family arsenite efflux pump ArsB